MKPDYIRRFRKGESVQYARITKFHDRYAASYYDKSIAKRIVKIYKREQAAVNYLVKLGYVERTYIKKSLNEHLATVRIETLARMREWLVKRKELLNLDGFIKYTKLPKILFDKWFATGKIEVTEVQYKKMREWLQLVRSS
jgi:hypothetical protein